MSRTVKIVLIIIVVLIIILAAVFAYIKHSRKYQILDGPGMVYEWPGYELYNTRWVEAGKYYGEKRCELSVSDTDMTLTGWDRNKTKFSFSLPEGTDTYGKPEGEVYLNLTDCREFDRLIFHEEQVGDKLIPVLSATTIEFDGRGEIIICEFVHKDDLELIPEDFRSTTCIKRNDVEPPPTYADLDYPILKNSAEESDLVTNEWFFAKVPKNRYGGSSEPGDYAEGRFILWLNVIELNDREEITNQEMYAYPYIVSDNGNEENLCMLSGGSDGENPYGDSIYRFRTDEHGEIIDAVLFN